MDILGRLLQALVELLLYGFGYGVLRLLTGRPLRVLGDRWRPTRAAQAAAAEREPAVLRVRYHTVLWTGLGAVLLSLVVVGVLGAWLLP
jgi:hypothetical protein